MFQHFDIVGTGLHLPQRRLSAEDIDRRAGLAEGWTRKHTGVLNRHECVAPETLGSMAIEAMTQAVHDAGISWSDVDLIMDGSTCRHQPIPCNAAYLQHLLGPAAQGIPCLDVQSTCLGFLLGVHVANALLATEAYRHIVIVCSEAALAGVDWNEPESATLMGDGAAAAVLRRRSPKPGYFFAHATHGEYLDACQIKGGGHNLLPSAMTHENEAEFRFHMNGARLFQAAGKLLPPMTTRLLQDAGLPPDQVQVIPHQASPRALALMRRLLGFSCERFHDRSANMGNLVAVSVPAVLHLCRAEGQLPPDEPVLLLGTSAGYAQAGLLFQM